MRTVAKKYNYLGMRTAHAKIQVSLFPAIHAGHVRRRVAGNRSGRPEPLCDSG